MTIGHDAIRQLLASRFAIHAIAQMRGGGQQAVRTQHAFCRGSRPNHILTQQRAVGKLGQCGHGGGDDTLIAHHDGAGRAHNNVRRIVSMQCCDAAIFPDFLGDPDDVVGKIFELGIKALHACHPLDHPSGMRAEPRTTNGPSISTRCAAICGVSILLSKISTVLPTIRLAGCRTVVRS